MEKFTFKFMIEKINIKTVGALLLALIVIFTFVSKTVYNYDLPVVTAISPVNGKLNKMESVKGIVGWSGQGELYTGLRGYVEDIMVEEGDRVSKGQELIRLSYTEEDLSAAKENEYELEQLDTEIMNAEEDREKAKVLFEAGAVSRNEYEQEERNLQALYAKREKLLADGGKLLNSEALTICASEDSTITELFVHKGQKLNEGEKVAAYGTSQGFEIQCSIPLENDFVLVGDTCRLENSSHVLEGIVADVAPEGNEKKVTIRLQAEKAQLEEIKEGETFDVIFEKESAESRILVPNNSLNQDNDGYYLLQVKRREGILGKEFYVEELRVYIGDNDTEYTVITEGIDFFEPIVLFCDQELKEGDIVILENEGEFFED